MAGTKRISLSNSDKTVLVDEDDYEKVLLTSPWRLNEQGYAVKSSTSKGQRRTLRMHALINGTPDGLVTDHINGNKLDNRKSNLRSVSQQINTWNRKPTDSRIYHLPSGISFDKTKGKYVSTKIIRKQFDTLEEAIAHKRESELYEYEHRRFKSHLPTGVFRNKNTAGYQARVQIKGKRYYLGVFPTIEEAEKAYLERRRG